MLKAAEPRQRPSILTLIVSLYNIIVMGLTYVDVNIRNPLDRKRLKRVRLLVDTGAFNSVVPEELLKAIGISPHRRGSFVLADGATIIRQVGFAMLRINGREAASEVIFGKKKDGLLLGVLALESLGLTVDPRTGKLKRIPMLLM